MTPNFGIMVHGGAGTSKIRTKRTQISKALEDSVSAGYDILLACRDAVDSVESAIASMEDSVFSMLASDSASPWKRE